MPSEKNHNDVRLVSLLSQDSHAAFQAIFNTYRNHIYKVGLIYLKSPLLAEEVVQEVFLKLWFHRKNLSNIISLEAWLYVVAKNLILNYLKKLSNEWNAKKKMQFQNSKVEISTDFKVLNAENEELLESALSTLSAQQRLVFKLAREENLTYAEIASRLSISPLTVKTHMARALSEIRAFFKEHGITCIFILSSIQYAFNVTA